MVLDAIGRAVRAARQERGLTIRGLAERAGLSERFLSDLERGVGNISIARLAEVADALEQPLAALVAEADRRRGYRAEGARPVALIGLRGAGKSTIGGRAARVLGWSFVELDQEIEAEAGLTLSELFEIHGDAHYRRLERRMIEAVTGGARGPSIVAVGGGVVSDDASWGLLRQRARTVWLSARPEDHYQRVLEQGDTRPMRDRPEAMRELVAILAQREVRYREADLTVDTSAFGLSEVVQEVVRFARSA